VRNDPQLISNFMTTDEIKSALRQLHSELGQSGPVDAELRDLLQLVETDIHSVLDPAAAPAEGSSAGLVNRLDAVALQLEVDHPKLAPVLRQVGEALSRIGI
jgi:hypothetical protein